MSDCALKGLRFQPILCNGLGDTIAQVLGQMMGSGMGGNGMMGGYGMVGLYGGLPDTFGYAGEYGDSHGGGADRLAGPQGRPHGENPDEAKPDEMFSPGAATAPARAPPRSVIAARWGNISSASPRKPRNQESDGGERS